MLPFIAKPNPSCRVRCRRGRHMGKQIVVEVGISPATVSRILRRLGLNRLAALEPAEPVHPGELIHIEIKTLGKFSRIGRRIPRGSLGREPCLHHCLQEDLAGRA